ncbi:MAG: dihydrolipoamide acetyltransferase family protein, partial [Proteobacteria bacterium]|nr:dihydrolipoamide acetyltransferase family protein [Pseudomonadota bacterium]
IAEIETDKATMAFASSAEGFVLKILAQPGKTVALGAPLCVVGAKGESYNLEELIANSFMGTKQADKKSPASKAPAQASAASSGSLSQMPAVADKGAESVNFGRLKASPLAKKVAADKGIDLRTVQGSGPSGRVIVRDLEEASSGASAGSASPSVGSGIRTVTPGVDQVVALTMMRKTIAKRLLAGKNDAPHFYLTVSADMSRMNDWRARLNKNADKTGVKVSVNDLITKSVAAALVRHPEINASWQGDSIIQYGNVHICMAVELPTGLVTPVIRYADQLSVSDIASTAKNLAGRAKDGKLGNEDYLGGTFTISNLGMFGIEEFTAIINPPQAAILAVGATIQSPWVDPKGGLVVQPRMKMTLSCDHRVIDGVMGAQFLKTLVEIIEEPLLML